MYVHRLRAGIAAMTASLEGLDVLVFTGGVSEHATEVRSRTTAGLGFLGVEVDPAADAAASGRGHDVEITAPPRSPTEPIVPDRVRTLVVQSREDLEIAAEVRSTI